MTTRSPQFSPCSTGALAPVPASVTAFGDRSAPFNVSLDSVWEDPVDDEANVDWTREVWRELHAFASGQVPGQLEEGEQLLRASYERLVEVKTAYDPTNLFRVHRAVEPLGAATPTEPQED